MGDPTTEELEKEIYEAKGAQRKLEKERSKIEEQKSIDRKKQIGLLKGKIKRLKEQRNQMVQSMIEASKKRDPAEPLEDRLILEMNVCWNI